MTIVGQLGEQGVEVGGVVKGVAIGIVTNNQDPKNLGRVKVRFPWREVPEESFWARLAVDMTGKDYGNYFLPEVGDEVLLAFERGDVRHPYVLGMLWNGKDTPPQTNSDGNNNIREIKTRSGHELIFNDDQAEPSIELHTKDGAKVYLDKHGIQLDDTKGNSVKIDSDGGAISLESKTKLEIKSAQISIQSTGTMEFKSTGTLTVKGAVVQIN